MSVAIGVAAVSARQAAKDAASDAPAWSGTPLAVDAAAPAILGGDEIPDVIISPGAGGVATRVLDGVSLSELGSGFPFGPGFGASVRTAVGELSGDGVADIVVAMGAGGSLVKLFNGATIAEIASGYPFGPGFAGGVSVATGDVNGDGREDIIVAQASGGGTVRVFSGTDIALLMSQAPFGAGYTGGVNVAAGDVDGDQRADVIVSQAVGGLVSVISGATQTVTVSGAPYGFLPGGVFVAAGDVNGDGRADVIAAPGSGGGPLVVYDVSSVSLLTSFVPYSGFGGGVRVAAADLNSDGRAEILTVPGAGRTPELHVYDGATFGLLHNVPVYPSSFTSGVYVSAPAVRCDDVTLLPSAGALPAGAPGVPYSFTFTATGGTSHVFTISGGPLPTGLTLSPAGVLSGTPTSTGNFTFRVSATNETGCAASNAYTLSVSSSAPQAQPDTFSNGVGNTQYSVGAGVPSTPAVVISGTVLSNDVGSGLTVVPAASLPTTQGGQVAMSAAGTFLYTPPAGFAGAPADTFTYTVTDGSFFDSAVVTINLSGVVWYVDAAAGGGDGRSHSPFNTMPAAAAAAQPGQVIYVRQGSPAGATVLKAGQTLWGAGATFTLNALVIPATTAPMLQGTITLANDVVVNSVAVNAGAGPGIIATNVGGSITIRDTSVTGAAGDGAVFHNQAGSMTLLIERTTGTPRGTCQFSRSGGRGLFLLMEGTATATVTVNRCRFRNNGTIGLEANAAGDANLTLGVTGPASAAINGFESEFLREEPDPGLEGILATNSGNADITVTIENSVFAGFRGAGIHVGQTTNDASASSMLRATIRGNRVESPVTSTDAGIVARLSSTGGQPAQARLLIVDNRLGTSGGVIQNGPHPGILVETPDAGSTPNVQVTVTNNHVDMLRETLHDVGLHVQATRGAMCANIQNNWSHWQPLVDDQGNPLPQGGGIRAEQGGTAAFSLERGSEPSNDAAAVLATNNPPPTGLTIVTEALGAITVVGNGTCQLPSSAQP